MAAPAQPVLPQSVAPGTVRLELPLLLRGDVPVLQAWLKQPGAARLLHCVLVIGLGAGLYGAAIGCWRSGLQAAYTAAKLPLILLLTALGNALLNGVLAPLLGCDLRFRQSVLAVLMSFALAAVILAAFAPLVAFLVWNLPPMAAGLAGSRNSFALLQLTTVAAVAFAGLAANVRLFQLLRSLTGDTASARRLLFAWLAANLLLGAQLAWIGRPFFGHPDLAVEFLRSDAFAGNFFETIAYNARELLSAFFRGFD